MAGGRIPSGDDLPSPTDVSSYEEARAFIDALPSRVRDEIEEATWRGQKWGMYLLLAGCASPIEMLLAVHLDRALSLIADPCDPDELRRVLSDGIMWEHDGRRYTVSNQWPMSAEVAVSRGEFQWTGPDYEPDFWCTAYVNGRRIVVLVECDGHDFHERTKQQVRRDNERQRALQLAGLRVIRFSGSEIHRNPEHCAAQVALLMLAEAARGV